MGSPENNTSQQCWGMQANGLSLSLVFLARYTKPLTFADCISDELPLGWEEAYDPQVGDYFIDHNTSKFSAALPLPKPCPLPFSSPPPQTHQPSLEGRLCFV